MKKTVKWIAISCLALVVLVLIALAVAPLLLPLESMMAQAIEKQTGRPTKIESVALSLLGGAEVEIKGLEVGELKPYGDRPLVKLNRFSAQFALLPLLDGAFSINSVEIDGLELSIVSSKQGKLNIQDMPSEPEARAEGEASKAPRRQYMKDTPPDKPRFFLGQLEMTGSVVHLHNMASGQSAQWPITQAAMRTKLHRDIGMIDIKLKAPGLNFMVKTSQGPADEPTRVVAGLDLDEMGKLAAVVLPGLQCRGKIKLGLDVRGTGENPELRATLAVDNLYVHQPQSGVAPLDLQNAIVELAATGDTPGQTVELHKLYVWLPSAGYELNAEGAMSPGKAHGRLRQKADLAKMSRAFAAFMPKGLVLSGVSEHDVTLESDSQSITLNGGGYITDLSVLMPGAAKPFTQKSLENRYSLKLDGKGNVLIDELGILCPTTKIFVKGNASFGKIIKAQLTIKGPEADLDPFMALLPAPDGEQPAKSQEKTQPGQPAAAGDKAQPSRAKGSVAADVRKALEQVDLNLNLSVGRVIYSGLTLEGLSAKAKAGQGKAGLEEFTCLLFDGRLTAKAALDARQAEPASGVDFNISHMKITPERFKLLQKATHIFNMPMRIVKGDFYIKSKVKAKGLTPEQIKRTASGEGKIEVTDGVEVAFDALDRMQGAELFAPLVRANIPKFYSRLDGAYTMADGKLDYNLNLLESREKIDVRVTGSTLLANGEVDAKLLLSGEGIGRDLKRFLGPEGNLPIEIKGTLDRPVAVLRVSGGLLKGLFGD